MVDGQITAAMAESHKSTASLVVEQPEYSFLVSKVFSALNTQLGLHDYELAKFVADLGRRCGITHEFDERLKELGIQIPNSLVCSLFNTLHAGEGSISDVDLALLKSIEENESREKFRVLIQQRRQNLPIYNVKSELIQAVHDNGVLVVTGEIGSGKTTQITQYLDEAGYTRYGRRIACTQPHREFVASVAERVAEEYGCDLGEQVGYATTLEDRTSENTLIKYMTNEVLLREIMADPNLSQYSVIVVDEADARTVYTDVLIGLLKQFVKLRQLELRLVVISAPMAFYAHKFSGYLFNCNVFNIPARIHPVNIVHLDAPHLNRLISALLAVDKILSEEGDILLFWLDDDEIDVVVQNICDQVKQHQGQITSELLILPVARVLESSVFKPAPPGKRKLVIASSRFAEACMTIDGIYYVIDPGVFSQRGFNPDQGLDVYVVKPISKASAMLRAGLAGRVENGTCVRLYAEDFCRDMMPSTYLEIQRLNLRSVALIMKAVGIQDLFSFDFMDPPPSKALTCATKQLYDLGALDNEGHLTQLGWGMAAFPLDPPLSKMLMAGVDLGCSDEILTIISMIQTEATYFSPMQRAKVQGKRAKFFRPGGDFLTMLAIFEEGEAHNFSEQWCLENFICPGLIQRAPIVRNELVRIMQDKCKFEVVSAGGNSSKIREAITSAFFFNAAKKDQKGSYRRLVDNRLVVVGPYSVLNGRYPQPEWVVCRWLSELFINGITAVDPQWLGIERSDGGLALADGANQIYGI